MIKQSSVFFIPLVTLTLLRFHATILASIETPLMTVHAKTSQHEKMPLLIGFISNTEEDLTTLGPLLKEMLSLKAMSTLGFTVTVQLFTEKPLIKKLYPQFPLALFINRSKDEMMIEWRLYDTHDRVMVQGKRCSRHNKVAQMLAEHIADQVWPILTGQPGFFATRIVFCTQEKGARRGYNQLCIIPPYALESNNDSNHNTVLTAGRIFAPRWNNERNNPLILYSETTRSNVRLMSINLQKERKVISNFEGLNILPSFAVDGTDVVYCIAQEGKSQLYKYHYDKELKHPCLTSLTNNEGNNVSPILCANGDVIYCSDFKTKGPQICYYHADTQITEVLTQGTYCACPAYNEKNDLIAYCKLVNGCMQLFIYSLLDKNHEQITYTAGNKEEVSWSPCGNFLSYSIDDGKTNRIALLNRMTKETVFLTDIHESCTYPYWSPLYQMPLCIS